MEFSFQHPREIFAGFNSYARKNRIHDLKKFVEIILMVPEFFKWSSFFWCVIIVPNNLV